MQLWKTHEERDLKKGGGNEKAIYRTAAAGPVNGFKEGVKYKKLLFNPLGAALLCCRLYALLLLLHP